MSKIKLSLNLLFDIYVAICFVLALIKITFCVSFGLIFNIVCICLCSNYLSEVINNIRWDIHFIKEEKEKR